MDAYPFNMSLDIHNPHPPGSKSTHLGQPMAQEVYEMIIDQIRGPDEENDLRACTLVCRAFVHRARARLYRRLIIKPLTNIDRFAEIYTEEGLLPYVRELRIVGCLTQGAYWGQDANSGHDENGQPDHTWMDKLPAFLTRFSNIESLHLHDLSWGDISTSTRQFLRDKGQAYSQNVKRLTLTAVDFWNSNQFFQILQSFKHAEEIHLEKISWHRTNHTVQQLSDDAPLTIRYLHLGQTEFARYAPVVQWLYGQREKVLVKQAFVMWEDTDYLSLVNLMRRIAPTMRYLEFRQNLILPGSEMLEATHAERIVQNARSTQIQQQAGPVPDPVDQNNDNAVQMDVDDEDDEIEWQELFSREVAPGPMPEFDGDDEYEMIGNQDADSTRMLPGAAAPWQDCYGAFPINNDHDTVHGDHIDPVLNVEQAIGQGHMLHEDYVAAHAGGIDVDGMDNDGDDDDDSNVGQPLEFEDDEHEEDDAFTTQKFSDEYHSFLSEVDANKAGVSHLDRYPVTQSGIVRLRACIMYSAMGPFAVQLMCQLFTRRTKYFSLWIIVPSRRRWDTVDWPVLDSIFCAVGAQAAHDATLLLYLEGVARPEREDVKGSYKKLVEVLPNTCERKRWKIDFDGISVV